MSIKNDIFCKAHELGADDAAFVENNMGKDNSCIIVLFFTYCDAPKSKNGHISLSPYYIASNKGYHAAKNLTTYIQELGYFAQHDTDINAKTQALKHGGFIGKNGFYYHEQFGSLINIQTIKTDAVRPDKTRMGADNCARCMRCIDACPTGAVGDLDNCLRNHSNSHIPEHLRHGLYQLLGCELCQTACPFNDKKQQPVPQYRTDKLLEGKHLQEIQDLAGSNMARKQRILSQAAIHAANTRQKNTLEQLKVLADTSPSPVKEHAEWAAKKLEADK